MNEKPFDLSQDIIPVFDLVIKISELYKKETACLEQKIVACRLVEQMLVEDDAEYTQIIDKEYLESLFFIAHARIMQCYKELWGDKHTRRVL